MTNQATDEIAITINGSVAVITLIRTKALNALTESMRQHIADAIPLLARDPMIYAVILKSASPKAFCSGSDVREVLSVAGRSRDDGRRLFADEYRMNWLLECFSKPTVSLINGLVMGGGVGITAYNTHRVAGETYNWSMPETMIGLFPDVGVCHALSRLGPTGMYLALTGRSIKRADAFHLGLATHCIDSVHYDRIEAELALANTVDPLLDGLHRDPGPGELPAYADVISQAFDAPSVADIIVRLEAERGPYGDWAKQVAADLRKRSPLSLEVTFRHVVSARAFDISQTLQADYQLACQFLEDGDFREGVRAALVDRDGAPAWQPARIEDVTLKHLAPYFRPMEKPLLLASREDMQRARV